MTAEKPVTLTDEELRAVGFIPGVAGYGYTECMHLNQQLAHSLAGLKPFSDEWFLRAKDIHQRAKSFLRCCG